VDPTGLGRWSGVTLEGKWNVLSIITAYNKKSATVVVVYRKIEAVSIFYYNDRY
jgi:hypothetical protein